MTTRDKRLQEVLGEVFMRANAETENVDQLCWEFTFHMTDWEADLARLADLYSNQDKATPDEAEKIVAAFLYHASDHILHAARIQYGYVPPSVSSVTPDAHPSRKP